MSGGTSAPRLPSGSETDSGEIPGPLSGVMTSGSVSRSVPDKARVFHLRIKMWRYKTKLARLEAELQLWKRTAASREYAVEQLDGAVRQLTKVGKLDAAIIEALQAKTARLEREAVDLRLERDQLGARASELEQKLGLDSSSH